MLFSFFKNKRLAEIRYFLNDPSDEDLTMIVSPPKSTRLPILVRGFDRGDEQATRCYVTLAKCMEYFFETTGWKSTRWATVRKLIVDPKAGREFNAYYDRTSLKFFFDRDTNKNRDIYTSDSPDIVAHEVGHAFLDMIRPDLWSVQSFEIWAFHESFSDLVAIFNQLQYDLVLEKVAKLDLMQSNFVSRLAEEMSLALGDTVGIRDAAEVVIYKNPKRMTDASNRDPHLFSRVFTGAYYEIFVKIAARMKQNGYSDVEAISRSRDLCMKYLVEAVQQAPATPRFFDAVAKNIHVADERNKGHYTDLIRGVFDDRKIWYHRLLMLSSEPTLSELLKTLPAPYVMKTDRCGTFVYCDRDRDMHVSNRPAILSIRRKNPLYDLDVESPADKAYRFVNDRLFEVYHSDSSEIFRDTVSCLDDIYDGGQLDKTFRIYDGSLIRKMIRCRCYRDNSCNPEAPEYGKGYKPDNQHGCCRRGKPVCDCEQPEVTPPPKLGCYVKASTGGTLSHRVGQRLSRRVC